MPRSLLTVKGHHLPTLGKNLLGEMGRDRLLTLAAAAAFHSFFALFPLLLFLAPLAGLIGDPRATVDYLMRQLTTVMPAEHLPVVQHLVEAVVFAPNAPGLMSVGLLLAAWSGSNVIGALIETLNTAYNVPERRPFVRRMLLRVAMFVASGLIVLFATIVLLQGDRIAAWAGDLLGLGDLTILAWQIGQLPLALGALLVLVFVIYRVLPNVPQDWRHVLVAAAFTTTMWGLATLVFRLYFEFFPPNPAYGFLGAIIILLTWIYYSMFIVLLGGELASELRKGSARNSGRGEPEGHAAGES